LEVKIVYKSPEKGDVKIIEVEGKRDKEKEVIVHYGIVPSKWKTWNDDDLAGMETDLFHQEKEINSK
jgi:hypothetical protein